MLGPSVFPDSRVIPECLVLQYFQIHRSYQNAWSFSISRFTGRKSSFEISKYTFFEICSEIRVSGPSHSIRLVKSVSKNSARAQINSKFLPKINFLMKKRGTIQNSSLLSPLGGFYITPPWGQVWYPGRQLYSPPEKLETSYCDCLQIRRLPPLLCLCVPVL